jgi:hypothetical protein
MISDLFKNCAITVNMSKVLHHLAWRNRNMIIKIGNFDITECWDGVFYKKLSNYPNVTKWEIQTIFDFIKYEESNGRDCVIEADNNILEAINNYKVIYNNNDRLSPPKKITECTACPKYKGCMTDFVCHTTSLDNAKSILKSGSLLSPVLARNISAEDLKNESRNAANDPVDYFDYIMFAWGNCQAGDRLVMERNLKRYPNDDDLSIHFAPGIRFFFKYDKLINHPNAVFDGVLPLKIKDEVILKDWVHAIIIPKCYKEELEIYVPTNLITEVYYLESDCKDIWQWSEKVYEYIKAL